MSIVCVLVPRPLAGGPAPSCGRCCRRALVLRVLAVACPITRWWWWCGKVLDLPEKVPSRGGDFVSATNIVSFFGVWEPNEVPLVAGQWWFLKGGLDPHFLGEQCSRDLGRRFAGAAWICKERQLWGAPPTHGAIPPARFRVGWSERSVDILSSSGDLSIIGPQTAEGRARCQLPGLL